MPAVLIAVIAVVLAVHLAVGLLVWHGVHASPRRPAHTVSETGEDRASR